jgi:hypothetical protein
MQNVEIEHEVHYNYEIKWNFKSPIFFELLLSFFLDIRIVWRQKRVDKWHQYERHPNREEVIAAEVLCNGSGNKGTWCIEVWEYVFPCNLNFAIITLSV